MRFLFIASGRSVPSTRFRILPYLPGLRKMGHRCDVAFSFPEKYDYFPRIGWRASQLLKRSVRRWHSLLARLRHYDTIVIEREVFDDNTWQIESSLRRASRRLVLDVDDGIHLLHPEKFRAVASMCDVAIAGNQDLAEVLRPLCPDVRLIPTCVRLAEYPARQPELTAERPTVGWIGTTGNVAFLAVCQSALREIANQIPYRLLVVAPQPNRLEDLDLSGVDVEFRRWSPATEVADIREMDVGLMPLPADEPWMRFKCGLKLIQYLAVGTPGIASPIGVNAEILAGNKVGFAAPNETQWVDALGNLLGDAELRQAMGERGRKLVREHYSIEANTARFAAVLTGTDEV